MKTRPLLIAVTLSLLTACSLPLNPSPTPTSTPTSTPTPTTTPTLTPTPTFTPSPSPTPSQTPPPTPSVDPTRSPTPEATRPNEAHLVDPPLRPFDYTVVNATPPRRVPNALRTFWVANAATGERREVTARLRAQTEHIAMWVELEMWHDVRQLIEAAHHFETQIYTTTRAAFGSEWTPGVDNDPHIHVLHTSDLGEGVLGYTSSLDEFSRDLYPYSNEAEMITVDLNQVTPDSADYNALLARQFQRLIQWNQDRNEERWVKEGMAELAVALNGFERDALKQAYLKNPDTPLTAWENERAQRGAAYLFAMYFHERFGDAGTHALTAEPLNGIQGIEAVLDQLGTGLTFESFFADWLAANYLDHLESEYPHYLTLDLEPPAPAATYRRYPVTLEASVQQFGADYVLLRGDEDLRVQFTGQTSTPLLDMPAHSGQYVWWSNQADESLTTLTRMFDLSSGEPVTMTYWTWYEIEEGYDYATVEVNVDGNHSDGQWEKLSPASGTGEGQGYTGESGGWIQEEIDLSPYAGHTVQIRFAYLTDEAITGVGFLLDDIAVPALDYYDDIETEGNWEADGFVRSDGKVAQRYLAFLIGVGDEITIEQLPVKQNQSAEWTIPLSSKGWREGVVVLSGLAPLTTQPAPYRLEITP